MGEAVKRVIVVKLEWCPRALPRELPVTQVYGLCFNQRGEILLTFDQGSYGLPGGKPEDGETREETLIREVLEEIQCEIESLEYIGYQHVTGDPDKFSGASHAQLRYACRITKLLPQMFDMATGRFIDRRFASPTDAAALLGWGVNGRQQIASACASDYFTVLQD